MAILEVRDLHKDFGGLSVLFGIDLSVEEGERHAIIGPNGAGKSTLFQSYNREVHAHSWASPV